MDGSFPSDHTIIPKMHRNVNFGFSVAIHMGEKSPSLIAHPERSQMAGRAFLGNLTPDTRSSG